MRKFLAYAKQIQPEMTEKANRKIQRYFTKIRNSPPNGSVTIVLSALHSLRRLAQGSARLRLSQEVTEDDAEVAIRTYNEAFSPLISTESGGWDADIIDLGISKLDRDRVGIMKKIIGNFSKNCPATLSSIKVEADKAGIPSTDALKILNQLKKTGDIMEIRNGEFVPY
jgi:replicative DNA helicase Mcm